MHFSFAEGHSIIHQIDPRVRLVAAAVLAVVIASAQRLPVLCLGLAADAVIIVAAGLELRRVTRRMLAANLFVAMLWIVVPVTTPGAAVGAIGPFLITGEGLARAITITLKCNAILGLCIGLIATIDPVSLGHALHHLRLPDKLTHMFLFLVRYLDVLHEEYARLRNAMRIRCFRPRADRRTWRAIGWLAGMLLVKSHERAERVLAAMKCRGFKGEFHVLRHFTLDRADAAFAVAGLALFLSMGWLEWANRLQ